MVDFNDKTAPGEKPRSTIEWGQDYLPAHFVYAPSAMHHWLGRQLDALCTERGSKINVIGPRGSAKSTVATFCYVLRAAVEGWEPYIWIVSDTSDQAKIHLDNLRSELSENEQLQRDYPEASGRGRHWRSAAIQLPNSVTIEAYGTGQRIRGRRRRAARPSLIVCDDLQNDSHIASAGQREVTRRWFQGTLLNAGTPRTNVVNLATALHREAIALELARTAGWTSRTFPAIETWPTNMELWKEWEAIYCDVENPDARHAAREFYEGRRAEMESGAIVLWPEVEDLYTLMRTRVEIGSTAFDREKQGLPVNPDMCEWPEAYFSEDIWLGAFPVDLTVRAIALDPSKGRDAGKGDFSAYVFVGIDSRGVIHVEADLARRPTPRMVADGVALCLRLRPHAFGVEANQYQELLCNELPQNSPGKESATSCRPRFKTTSAKRCGFAAWDPICRSASCGFWQARRRRGCSWSSCAIFPAASMMTDRMRWRWRCAWRTMLYTNATRMTDWGIDCWWDEGLGTGDWGLGVGPISSPSPKP